MRRKPRPAASIGVIAVACFLTACGRVGFELWPLDGGGTSPDADADVMNPDDPDAAADPDAEVDAGPPLPCQGLCQNAHGTTECRDERCMPDCETGYLDCDGNPQNGCETSVSDQTASCGSCDVMCSNPMGTTGCDAGTCAPVCEPESADCDDDPRNGCEAALATSAEHCGGCGVACTNAHGMTACVEGACVPTCDPGYRDCDGDPRDGCETNVVNDPRNCGGCGITCGARQTCVAMMCQTTPCATGTGDCDANPAVCETNTTNTVAHCGFCGNACTLANANPQCVNSACGIASCRAPFGNCDGQTNNGCEVNTNTTVAHCGGCGMACTNAHGSQSCAAGACVPTCSTGWGSCDGNTRNGCETQLNSVTHCGGCNVACTTSVPNATADCSTGACVSRCNSLSGVYAVRVRAATSWPRSGFIAAGSGNHDYVARVTLTQSGLTLSGTATPCGRAVPEFRNNTTSERYQVLFPDALFDRTLSSANLTITLGGPGAGATFVAARAALTLGINLGNPVADAWPNLSTARNAHVDQDADGDRGVTITYRSGGGFSQPQTAGTLGATRARAGWLTERVRFTLNGSLTSCTAASGNANAEAVDTHTIGCRLTNNGECSSSQYQHLDTQAPNYNITSSTFTMVRVANSGTSVSCAAIRAALP